MAKSEQYVNTKYLMDVNELIKRAQIEQFENHNFVEAEKLYLSAAELGSGHAAHELGILYISGGPGVEPDYEKSQYWLEISLKSGFEGSVATDPEWFKKSLHKITLYLYKLYGVSKVTSCVKTVISIAITLTILIVVIGYFVLSDLCENEIISLSTSPNGNWKVVLFERSCGATTGYTSQISLVKAAEQLPNEAGNIYVESGYPGGYQIEWVSDNKVNIRGVKGKWSLKLSYFKGVQFSYE